MATKQQMAERIAALTRDGEGDELSKDDQAKLAAELVEGNRADQLKDRLKAMRDPIPVPPTPDDEPPGKEVATTAAAQVALLDGDRLELLRRTLAADLNDNEFAIYAAQCNLRQLDPFANQIHAVVRTTDGERKLAIQTGIDGFRVIADRTGCYAGSDDPMYEGEVQFGTGTNAGVAPLRATVTVRKIVQGQVFEVTRHAYWEEYYPGDGPKGFMWRRMPHVMLAKCAEAQALRAAFPADLSGLYADEEMAQATVEVSSTVRDAPDHDEGTEVERWRIGFNAALEAAEPDKLADLAARWKKIEPPLLPLKHIKTMRDMRRAVAVAKSTLKVQIHPADEVPETPPEAPGAPQEGDEPQPAPDGAPIQDRPAGEDTIDVPSTVQTGHSRCAFEECETLTPEEYCMDHADAANPAAVQEDAEPESCAAGDGPITAERPAMYSEDGKPYHADCAPFLEDGK